MPCVDRRGCPRNQEIQRFSRCVDPGQMQQQRASAARRCSLLRKALAGRQAGHRRWEAVRVQRRCLDVGAAQQAIAEACAAQQMQTIKQGNVGIPGREGVGRGTGAQLPDRADCQSFFRRQPAEDGRVTRQKRRAARPQIGGRPVGSGSRRRS